eukprot:6278978-Amphidinium_carterae.1
MSGVVRVFGAAELGKLAQMTLLGELTDWAQLARADVASLFSVVEIEVESAPLSLLADFSDEEFIAMVDGWTRLKDANEVARSPNALEKARARLLRQAAMAVAQGQKKSGDKQGSTLASADSTSSMTVRKLKMSSVLDVNDEGVVPQATPQK